MTHPTLEQASTGARASTPPGSTPEPGPSGGAAGALALRWRRWRWPVLVAALVVLAGLSALVLLRPTSTGYLDPGNVAPDGTRALAQVLGEHGVEVRVRDQFADVQADLSGTDGQATLVVARPDLLVGSRPQDLRRLVAQSRADLVLVEPQAALTADLQLPVQPAASSAPTVVDPGCTDDVAVRAGSALSGGTGYRSATVGVDPAQGSLTASCYPSDAGPSYVVISAPDGRRTTLLGTGATLTNERLADAGDAALAIGTLARHNTVLWWTPQPTDTASGGQQSLRELLPKGIGWAGAQLVVVLLVVVLWRARRLGRLVPEPLPVVVRSVETTLGRARLYRRARARGRAAQVLRAAAVRRIAVRCSLTRTTDPREVAAVVATRTGRPAADVTALLVGADPTDDSSLVTLAGELDALETEVRRP